jgi:hypothetical protein
MQAQLSHKFTLVFTKLVFPCQTRSEYHINSFVSSHAQLTPLSTTSHHQSNPLPTLVARRWRRESSSSAKSRRRLVSRGSSAKSGGSTGESSRRTRGTTWGTLSKTNVPHRTLQSSHLAGDSSRWWGTSHTNDRQTTTGRSGDTGTSSSNGTTGGGGAETR